MGLSLPIGIVIAVLIATMPPESRRPAWRCLGWAALLFMIFSIPFWIQLLLGSDSLGVRAGIFEVVSLRDRLLILDVFLKPLVTSDLFYAVCGLSIVLLVLGKGTRKTALFLYIILFGYILSLLLYIMILPKQAQVYHYFNDFG
jgi:hypothetical protein